MGIKEVLLITKLNAVHSANISMLGGLPLML